MEEPLGPGGLEAAGEEGIDGSSVCGLNMDVLGMDSEETRSGLGHWVKEGATAGASLCFGGVQGDIQWVRSPPLSQTFPALKLSQGLVR